MLKLSPAAFSAAVTEEMVAQAITVAELAKRLGITTAGVYSQLGARKRPQGDTVARYAKALKLAPKALLARIRAKEVEA